MEEDDGENFVVTVPDDTDERVVKFIEELMRKHEILSTGSQFGAGCAEYFFAVKPEKLEMIENALFPLSRSGIIKYDSYNPTEVI